MREQKLIIQITGIICVISFIISVMLQWKIDIIPDEYILGAFQGKREFCINTTLGIATGALLSCVIAIIQYQSERKKFTDEFCNLTEDFIEALERIEFIHLRGDISCFAAYCSNGKYCSENGIITDEQIEFSKKRLLDSYRHDFPECNPELLLHQDCCTMEQDFQRVVNSYFSFSGFRITAFERLLSQKKFFITNCKCSKQIDEVYQEVKRAYRIVSEKTDYMKEFGAINNLIVQVNELQTEIFGKVKTVGSVTLLPPDNIEATKIRKMLSYTRKEGKINA